MKTMHYFVRPLPGTPHRRYLLGHWRSGGPLFVVTKVLMSRPDGDEIAEPAQVSIEVEGRASSVRRRPFVQRSYSAPAPAPEPVDPAHLRCARCKLVKPLDAFTPGRRKAGGYCTPCMREYAKGYRERMATR